MISVPPEGGSRSQLRVRTAPCPSGSASETNNECQIKFELLQLIAYLGLVPSEHSSGASVKRGGLTKAGNSAARRLLIEAAWTYRFPARVSRELRLRQEEQPRPICEIAWKAQLRLCVRYRKLARSGKPANVVTAAIARELAGFVWAIARRLPPAAG